MMNNISQKAFKSVLALPSMQVSRGARTFRISVFSSHCRAINWLCCVKSVVFPLKIHISMFFYLSRFWIVLYFVLWLYFPCTDAVYTERYMGKPSENSDSYKVNIMQISLITIIFLNCYRFVTWDMSWTDIFLLPNRIPLWRPEQRTSLK